MSSGVVGMSAHTEFLVTELTDSCCSEFPAVPRFGTHPINDVECWYYAKKKSPTFVMGYAE